MNNYIETMARCLIYCTAYNCCLLGTMQAQMAAYLKAIFDELVGIRDEELFADAQITAQLMQSEMYRKLMRTAAPVPPMPIKIVEINADALAAFDEWFMENVVTYHWTVETFVKSMGYAVSYLYEHTTDTSLFNMLQMIFENMDYRNGRVCFSCFRGDFATRRDLWADVTSDEWRMFDCFDDEL